METLGLPCYHPVPAYQAAAGAPLRLWPPIGSANLAVPCGECLGCRSARATMWAHRCMHEASLYRFNSFITLTYADEHLPKGNYLDAEALTLFFKRLRERVRNECEVAIDSDRSKPLKYFACGEYGELNGRPHYHALLFNCWFNDLSPVGKDLFSSAMLGSVWRMGHSSIGRVSGASANYVAQYSLKKQGQVACDGDGVFRPKPFLRMSQGIGAGWLSKFKLDVQHGYLVVDGSKRSVPRAYLERLRTDDPQLAEQIGQIRWESRPRGEAASAERLADAEVIHRQRSAVNSIREV